jgi:hypothetical protein
LIDDPVLEASGITRPPRILRWLVPNLLRLRAFVLRWLPGASRPRHPAEMKRPTYPNGYVIEALGPKR